MGVRVHVPSMYSSDCPLANKTGKFTPRHQAPPRSNVERRRGIRHALRAQKAVRDSQCVGPGAWSIFALFLLCPPYAACGRHAEAANQPTADRFHRRW